MGRFILREVDGEVHLGQWITFVDDNGTGWAQPDIYIVREDCIFLLECKLTQTQTAIPQLLELYVPLLREIYKKPIYTILVCRNLRWKPKRSILSITDFMAKPEFGIVTWNYVGL